MIVLPPLFAGGVNNNASAVLPPIDPVIVGASGAVGPGTAVLESADAAPDPAAFVARTEHRYVRPLVRPPTRIFVLGGTVLPRRVGAPLFNCTRRLKTAVALQKQLAAFAAT